MKAGTVASNKVFQLFIYIIDYLAVIEKGTGWFTMFTVLLQKKDGTY